MLVQLVGGPHDGLQASVPHDAISLAVNDVVYVRSDRRGVFLLRVS
jgi:hypothetical protein